jgi:membrane protease YdiL (CAAX protease family)
MSFPIGPRDPRRSRFLRAAAIVVIFLAIVWLRSWVAPWHDLLMWINGLTKGLLSHESLEAIISSIEQALTVCLCTLTVMWLFGKGIAAAFQDLGLRGGIVRGLAVGIVATLPLPVMYAIWWHARFDANTAVQVGVFGFISGVSEELLFRGFAFGLLYRKLRLGFWLSIILPTILFAQGHLYQVHELREYVAIVAITSFGNIWFGWLYVRWEYNLWVPVAVHALMNSWWTIFSVSQTALGAPEADYARLLTIALTVVLTLWHCGGDWRKAFLHIRPDEQQPSQLPQGNSGIAGLIHHGGDGDPSALCLSRPLIGGSTRAASKKVR